MDNLAPLGLVTLGGGTPVCMYRHKGTRLFSGTTYGTGGERYWRDCLHFTYDFPVGNCTMDWPDKPRRLR